MEYIYIVIRHENEPASPQSGQIWIKIDSSNNDIQAYIYIGNTWSPFG